MTGAGGVLDSFRLEGRVALVTGATRGLGRAIAEALASAGAAVAVTGRDAIDAERAAGELAAACGARVQGFGADVRVAAEVDALPGRGADALGGLGILINNAGVTARGGFEELTPEQWSDVLETNLTGVWRCCRAAAPALRASGHGRIVNVSSMLGAVGKAGRSAYSASKGGVTALTRALAVELAPDGVTVNAICPGPFQTDLADAGARAGMLEQIPLGRWGDPVEIGAAALFLASDAAGFMTGTTLTIDGGYTAQ
jgi:NAD(P)-dependent dehydrogenase (short-subunit alcohol dehydrogenase family)